MLTAISVAGECGMLAESDKVIVVDAEIQSKAGIPTLRYYYANKVVRFQSIIYNIIFLLSRSSGSSVSLPIHRALH